jgi:hypothetical protein
VIIYCPEISKIRVKSKPHFFAGGFDGLPA